MLTCISTILNTLEENLFLISDLQTIHVMKLKDIGTICDWISKLQQDIEMHDYKLFSIKQ